jgi:hypothetical protein
MGGTLPIAAEAFPRLPFDGWHLPLRPFRGYPLMGGTLPIAAEAFPRLPFDGWHFTNCR